MEVQIRWLYQFFQLNCTLKCRISLRFTKSNPRPPSCFYHWLSVSIHPNLSLCGLEVHHSFLWPFPPWKNGGFPNHRVSKSTKSIMICLVAQFHHLEKYEFVNGKDYYPIYGKIVSTPLKNMSSSVGMMTFLTEWKNVPNHQTVFLPESVWAKGSSNSGGLSNIFTYSHLLIFSSSHPHILTFSLALLPSCCLALLLSPSFLFLSRRRGAVPTRQYETQPFRTKWGSIAKNWGKIAISLVRAQPFRTTWGSIDKNWGKISIFKASGTTLSHEMRFHRQKLQ